ncbi:hypothetical protein JB92DRAFT_3039017 [Gautieria morchelliformis]|nr:hypothetical protein JB92DRAFT_3039017 [Gautieria morchelliformis]
MALPPIGSILSTILPSTSQLCTTSIGYHTMSLVPSVTTSRLSLSVSQTTVWPPPSQLSTTLIGSHAGSVVPSVTSFLMTLPAVGSTITSAPQVTHTPTSMMASAPQATNTPTSTIGSASQPTHTPTSTTAPEPQPPHTPASTIASAPQASHGSSAILIGAVLGGIMFFLVCLILMLLLRSRRTAALLSTQTETHTSSRRWDALDRIFHTRHPADTTPFRLSEAEMGAGRGPTDLNQKHEMASQALPPVTQPLAMPAQSPGQITDDHSVHQSVMTEDQLPSYSTIERVGAPP